MINKVSEILTDSLLSGGIITEDEQELYVYGFSTLLSQLIYFVFVCILGLIMGCIFESIFFYIAFLFIRRYAGGFHASTEIKCAIISAFSILASIVVIRVSKIYDTRTILFSTSLASAVCIFCLSPLDTAEKPLSEKEFISFRRISRLILMIILSIIILSYVFDVKLLIIPSSLSLILESLLLIAGIIKKKIPAKN